MPGEASLIFFIATCVSHAKAAQENNSRVAPTIALKNGAKQERSLIVGSIASGATIRRPEANTELEPFYARVEWQRERRDYRTQVEIPKLVAGREARRQ